MGDIKNDCYIVLKDIKKASKYLELFMYSTGGLIFILMTPFIKLHKKYFDKVEKYIDKIKSNIKDNNIDIEIQSFKELENSAILYNKEQFKTLTYKQYEAKLNYLKSLNDSINTLINLME